MFDYQDTLEVLQNFKRLSEKKRRKIITSLFFDETFIEWLFQPKQVPNLTEMVAEMYGEFTKPIVMQSMIDSVKYEGYSEFNRSHATFLYSVANIAIEGNNEFLKEVSEKKKSGDYSGKEANRIMSRIDDSNEIIVKLMKSSRKIVKRDVSSIARESNLPKYIVMAALTSVPEDKYVDHIKIGFYLNNLLNTIYSDVEKHGDFDEDVKWKVFFRNIFGKDNVIECATYILLEGVTRFEKYKNSDEVRKCWDSLTSFALKELNESPGSLRDQMLELYIKKISKMFANHSYDLRVDLLDISKNKFPQLKQSVDKYADKIIAIIKKDD